MTVIDSVFPSVGSRRVLLVLTGILFLTFVDTTIMSVALENLQGTLHTSISDLQWIINAYALMFASLMFPFGTLGDRLG
ncbi:MAG: MFS transporter, partial [Actinobacteria bacterium]|nr:MFS transporter [Actinomycetota bacterium]